MDIFYMGTSQGKVAHIVKPDSVIHKHYYDDYQLTLCGIHLNMDWWSYGLFPWGDKYPDYVRVCKRCYIELSKAKE